MYLFLLVVQFLTVFLYTAAGDPALRCTVCKSVVKEIVTAIKAENPLKKVEVGSFRIEPDGNQKKSQVRYAGSEIHLNEVLESVCEKMDDYAQAKHKETGELYLLKLTEDIDKIKDYDFVQDPDLNKGLKFNCENLVSDHDEDIIEALKGNVEPDIKAAEAAVCVKISGLCRDGRQEL